MKKISKRNKQISIMFRIPIPKPGHVIKSKKTYTREKKTMEVERCEYCGQIISSEEADFSYKKTEGYAILCDLCLIEYLNEQLGNNETIGYPDYVF